MIYSCGLIFPDLADLFPDQNWRFWDGVGSVDLEGHPWLGGEFTFLSGHRDAAASVERTSFRLMPKNHAVRAFIRNGGTDGHRLEIPWYRTTRTVHPIFGNLEFTGDRFRGRVLRLSEKEEGVFVYEAESTPIARDTDVIYASHDDHQLRHPDDDFFINTVLAVKDPPV